MKFIQLSVICLAGLFALSASATNVKISTNHGDIIVELNDKKAPKTVKNFLAYVKKGHYKDTVFHRVIKNFMIQGGGFNAKYEKQEGKVTVKNEADNGLKNNRGTISMARTNDPHSGSAQFFINTKDNNFLNYTAKTPQGWGYAVFGKVINGMKTVDKIEAVKTGAKAMFSSDVPLKTVMIHNISIIK